MCLHLLNVCCIGVGGGGLNAADDDDEEEEEEEEEEADGGDVEVEIEDEVCEFAPIQTMYMHT